MRGELVIDWLQRCPCVTARLMSGRDSSRPASRTEIRQWLANRSFLINGRDDWAPFEEMPQQIESVVLFHRGKLRTTVW